MNPELTSERLALIPFTPQDLDIFHSINTDEFVRKFLWDDEAISKEVARDILQQNQQHFGEEGWGLWKVRLLEKEEVMGYVGLWYFFDEPQPQLLYAFLRAFTGNGYATEASKALLAYVFEYLYFEYVLAATDEGHADSQRVSRRLGMKFVEKRMENGKPTLFYRLNKSDFLNSTYES